MADIIAMFKDIGLFPLIGVAIVIWLLVTAFKGGKKSGGTKNESSVPVSTPTEEKKD